MKNLGTFINKRSGWVLITCLIFVIISVVYGTTLFSRLNSAGFQVEGSSSYKAFSDIQNKLPQTDPEIIVLLSDKSGKKATNPSVQKAVEKVLSGVKNEVGVETITSYYTSSSPAFLSHDQAKTFVTINMKGDRNDQTKTFPSIREKLTSSSLDIKVGGQAATNAAFTSIIENDLKIAETISFSLLAVLLVIVFRGLVAATLPLLVGGFSILGAFLVTRLLTNVTDISQFAINVIIFLGLGLAIDYSLFIVSRFREELRASGNVDKAILTTMTTAGRTVMFSGIIVMISLLALLIFPLGFLRSMGLGGAAAVLIAMLGALVLLPAILSKLGTRVYALSFGSVRREKKAIHLGSFNAAERRSVWYRLSLAVMKHPLLVILLTLTPLLLAGLPFLRAELQTPDYRSLPKGNEVRLVSESLRNDFPSKVSPIQIVIKSNQSLTTKDNLAALDSYTKAVESLSGVSSSESLIRTIPGLNPQGYAQLFAQNSSEANQLSQQYLSSDSKVSFINVYYEGMVFSRTNQQLVAAIRDVPPPSSSTLDVQVGGNTAELVDLLAALRTGIPYALALIIVTLFILLFLMIGSVIIPLKAILLNILSLAASFGAIVWVFQDGHFEKLLGFESVGAIDANQPILIFAIAFGLSMDYTVFLLSRIKEQYDKTKNTEEAVAEGVQKTGSIITSAALLLIVVVGAFGTSQIPLMKQLAVGLVLAIAIDAVIIRMLLVPASMKLLGKYNWWAPRPLKRLYERLALGE